MSSGSHNLKQKIRKLSRSLIYYKLNSLKRRTNIAITDTEKSMLKSSYYQKSEAIRQRIGRDRCRCRRWYSNTQSISVLFFHFFPFVWYNVTDPIDKATCFPSCANDIHNEDRRVSCTLLSVPKVRGLSLLLNLLYV